MPGNISGFIPDREWKEERFSSPDNIWYPGDTYNLAIGQGYIGITGTICDWDLAKRLVDQSRIPVILAGGLSPENVYQALTAVFPAGADSCTHTNRVDAHGNPIRFHKDFNRVKAFVEEVRRYEGYRGRNG